MSVSDVLTTAGGLPVWDSRPTVISANGQVLIGPSGGVPAWASASAALAALVDVLTVSPALLPDWELLTPGSVCCTTVWVLNASSDSLSRFFADGQSAGAPLPVLGSGGQYIIGTVLVGIQVWIGQFVSLSPFIPDFMIHRLNLDGTSAGPDLVGNGMKGSNILAVIGSQVWVPNYDNPSNTNSVSRFNFDGTVAGSPIVGNGLSDPQHAAQIGPDEVWVINGRYGTASICRFHLDGTPIDNYASGMSEMQAIAVVNGQVWIIYGVGAIARFQLNGTRILPDINTGLGENGLNFLAVVGSEVWIPYGGSDINKILRLRFDGTSAGPDIAGNGLYGPFTLVNLGCIACAPSHALFDSNIGAGQTWTVANDTAVPATYSSFTGNQPRSRVIQGNPAGASNTRGFDDSAWDAPPHQSSSTFHPAVRPTPPYLPPISEVDIVPASFAEAWRRAFVPPALVGNKIITGAKLWMWNAANDVVEVNGRQVTADLTAGVSLDLALFDIQGGIENVITRQRSESRAFSICVVGSQVWAADYPHKCIHRLNTDGTTADWPIMCSTVDAYKLAYNASLDMVWVTGNFQNYVQRYHADGSSAGADFTAIFPRTPSAITAVGNEFWCTFGGTSNILRYLPDGTFIGTITAIFGWEALVFDGTLVWDCGNNPGSGIVRFNTSGVFVDHITFADPIQAMAVVGAEMWVVAGNYVARLDIGTGAMHGSFTYGGAFQPQGMAVVGTQVWLPIVDFGTPFHAYIRRFDAVTPVSGAIPDVTISAPLAYRIAISYSLPPTGVWIASRGNARVVRVNTDGTPFSPGFFSTASFPNSFALVQDPTHGLMVWLASGNGQVVAMTPDFSYSFSFSTPLVGGVQTAGAVGTAGDEVWYAEYRTNTIARFRRDGTIISEFLVPGLHTVRDIKQVGNKVWITNFGGVSIFNLDGTIGGGFNLGAIPWQMCVVGSTVWITRFNANFLLISRFNFDGTPVPGGDIASDAIVPLPSPLPNASGICMVNGEVWLASETNSSIYRFTTAGAYIGSYPVTSPSLSQAYAMCYPDGFVTQPPAAPLVPVDSWTGSSCTPSQHGFLVTCLTSFAASSATPTAGGTVTLTATANRDVGPTSYRLVICDGDTEIAFATSGTSLSVTVTSAAAATHTYTAYLSPSIVPDGSGAVSGVLVVVWS